MNDVASVAVSRTKARAPATHESPRESPVPKLGGAVRWLLGARLLASAKDTLVATVFGRKLDAREWMKAEIVPCGSPDQERFWFDYIADSGDSGKATFSVACLCQSDLVLEGPRAAGTPVSFAGPGAPEAGHTRLERGEFLFVGGDTAYHVANYDTLARQFQYPFNAAAERCNAAAERRRVFAIPGNHDYYDALHGFNLQFRAPTEPNDGHYGTNEGPKLRLDGFVRQQQASYVALKLPHEWWFFGLDSQQGRLSTVDSHQSSTCRQFDFFKKVIEQHTVRKLVVATPEPSTTFGQLRRDRYAREPDKDHLSATFKNLGLPLGFDTDGLIEDGCCQLDLSGDVHQYARYWGPKPGSERDNYASVVSGLGGAFVHPTQVRRGDLEPRQLYPSPDECRKRTAQLALPWVIAVGGWVWALGAFVGAIVYFARFAKPLAIPSLATIGMLQAAGALLVVCIASGLLLFTAHKAQQRIANKAETTFTTTAERVLAKSLYVVPLLLFMGTLPFIVPYEMTDFLLSATLLVLVLGLPLGLGYAGWVHGGEGLSLRGGSSWARSGSSSGRPRSSCPCSQASRGSGQCSQLPAPSSSSQSSDARWAACPALPAG